MTSSDRQSEHFLKKLNRARFALARTDSIRSVCGSLIEKPPYRRAASIPIHLQSKVQPKGRKKINLKGVIILCYHQTCIANVIP